MAFDFGVLLNYNSTTFLLVSIVTLLYTIRAYLQPAPLAHPLLLGRQADVSRVRKRGETAVYRNYGVGHEAPLPTRPKNDLISAHDVIQEEFKLERTLWNTRISNEKLRARIQAVGNGLIRTVGLSPNKSTALILIDDSFEWLLIDLALSAFAMPSIALTKLNLLSAALEHNTPDVIFTDVSLLEPVLEHVAEEGNHFPIVLVGENAHAKAEASRNTGFNVVTLDEVEASGKDIEPTVVAKPQAADLLTTSFYDIEQDAPVGVKLSHENLTAGITTVRTFFTLTTPLSASSTVVSAFPLATPFGRSIAYTALLEGSNLITVDSTSLLKGHKRPGESTLDEIVRAVSARGLPRPTHLFITPSHLEDLTSAIISHASGSFFGGWAWARKLVELSAGALSDNTYWDSLGGLIAARRKVFGYDATDPWFKAVVVAGGPVNEINYPTSRLALSIPIVNAHIEPLSTSPIFASHPFDLQHFPPRKEDEVAHVGPPAANVEVKIIGDVDTEVDSELGDPTGKLLYRGPSVGERVPALVNPLSDDWIDSRKLVVVHSNGTFKIVD